MRINHPGFEQTTGYRLLNPEPHASGARLVRLSVPGTSGAVDLPAADAQRLFESYQALRGPSGAAPADANAIEAVLDSLRADLNLSLFDGSPFMVTKGEVRHAHSTLMRLAPGEIGKVLLALDDKMLNRYLVGIAKAEPFSLEATGPGPLGELALKLTLELSPAAGATLVARLGDEARRRLLEGLLQLPTGELVMRAREVLGSEAFRELAGGGLCDSTIGGGLADGRVHRENVTADFKSKYAAAVRGELSPPSSVKDTVFLLGPGLFGDQLPGYLEPNRRALVESGVPAENVAKLVYNTADHPSENADRIYAQIKAKHDSGQRVVVMGHSKFGRDMLEAFARHPELKTMVSGAIMMQPALAAPIAKDLSAFPALLEPILRIVGGNQGAFDGMAAGYETLPAWPRDVPTVLMASSTESKWAALRAGDEAYYKKVYNAASDGAVTLQDQASLDGAYLVLLPGLADHAQAGLTFTDGCEHFAKQIEAGAPDAVVSGMLERMREMSPKKGMFDFVVKAWVAGHSTPEDRARCVALLRHAGPLMDRFAERANKDAGRPLVSNVAMTKALVAQLFERLEPKPA